ncbi:MAG: helix-turn-helix domain-containing protein [Chloroflexi bacterium]|nr:helix-turn-helix domain-containing protein [Chloroflexota bacterium]
MDILALDKDLSLGLRVRLARIARRWRQVDLAAAAGVSQRSVSALELDHRLYPGEKVSILAALGLEDSNG